ncbi:hypothetical protein NHX12_031460 [Muraenolepis orangiensis]|uniref:TNRC6 PABC binding domain-containing protein n=1 Tax=Muraenolepis orangiensis TaxID=630683 RepID=A0A9Q0E5N6_9TELE|nr:hypothetical protein NHX12_031460 [Muraenolepis orangiensis]
MAPIRDSVSHSPNQTGLEHPGLDSQYEPSWSTGSPCSGSDPELASECTDADSSSPLGSERNLSTVSATSAMMSLANPSTSSASPCVTSAPTAGALTNGDGDGRQILGGADNGNNNNPCGPSHYSMAGSGGTGSNNALGGHGNGSKRLVGSGVWGAQPAGNSSDGGNGPRVNGGLNPSTLNPIATHGAWPHGPTPNLASGQGQRPPQAQSLASKLGTTPQEGRGGTAAQGTCSPADEGKVNSGGPGAPLANGTPTSASQHPHGEMARGPGAFGTSWGAATYPGDKGPANQDTVNPQNPALPQAGSSAAHKSYNHTAAPGAPRWDQVPGNNPAQSGAPRGTGSNPAGGSVAPGTGTTGPRPWGSSASSSSSSSSASNNMSTGEWGTMPPGNNHATDNGARKVSSSNNGWKSLEDDALGTGVGGSGGSGGPGGQAPGGWGRSGGSEGSGESSGGRSSGEKDGQKRSGTHRRPPPPAVAAPPPVVRSEVDPRVLSNTGWGQTPVRQNTTWDVTSTACNSHQGPRGEERKPSNGGSGWGAAQPAAPSQANSGGWRDGPGNSGPDKGPGWGDPRPNPGWGDNKGAGSGGHGGREEAPSYKGSSSNTWSNTNRDDRSNTNHWGDHQKGGGSGAWDGEGERSGSGGWSESGRAPNTNTNSGNTWTGSSGANAPDQGNQNPGSNSWGDAPAPKSNPQSKEATKAPASPQAGWGTSQSEQEPMAHGPPPGHQSHQSQGTRHPPQPMQTQAHEKTSSAGWGEYSQHKEPPSWAEAPSTAPSVSVDNGTSAWGKPVDGVKSGNNSSSSTWDEHGRDQPSGREPGPGWGGQHKTGVKPMETWGGEDQSSSWDQEEEVEIGMWSNTGGQQDGRSHDHNTWNYKQKGPNKMNKPVNKQEEPWMKPFVNQFNNINFPRDSPDDSMKAGGGGQDKRMDMGSMGDYSMGKSHGPPRHQLHKEPSMDRSPYYDKNVNPMLGGNSVAQGRGGAQLPPPPNLRNQVPPPILPSQVPPSLLKYPVGSGALNPMFGPQQPVTAPPPAQSQRTMSLGRLAEQTRPIGSSPMMPPPRHLDPVLLKQAAPHKPYPENYMSHNAPELQKDPGALGSLSNFPLGLPPNLNVPMDVGGGVGVGYKEPPQSRMKKLWATDPLEQSSKHGAMSGLRLEDSPFYDFLSPGPSPLTPPAQSMGSVGDGWPPRANSPPLHGNTVTWPPEFRPGEPWKGYPNIDPETDPFVTPGSVINNLSINTVRDTDHLRDRNNGPSSSHNTTMPSTSAWSSIRASSHSGSLTSSAQSTSARPGESKWSPGGGSVSNSSLAHELWKSRFTPGSSWSDGSVSSSGRSQWLVLKNLTPQIDGSTLRTLCMQHGPLITFHLNLPHGNAVVCYSSKDEAAKAQKSLHMCVLGNTTILADFASEEEINRFFAQGQSLAAPSSGWQAIGSSQSRMELSHPFPSRAPEPNQWNGSDLHSSTLWGGPNYSSSLWGAPSGTDGGRMSSPSPISSFLPVDHLAGAGDSM